jgi:hypothetical protein
MSEENVSILIGEIVLMQTAQTEVRSAASDKSERVCILLDSGSQRTYISESLANKLGARKGKEEEIRHVTFGSEKQTVIKTYTTRINVKPNNSEYLKISANKR